MFPVLKYLLICGLIIGLTSGCSPFVLKPEKESEEEISSRLYSATVDYAGATYANLAWGQANDTDYAKARMAQACKDYIESYGKEKLDKYTIVAIYGKHSWLHNYMYSLYWKPALCERIMTDIRDLLESVKKRAEEGGGSNESGGK